MLCEAAIQVADQCSFGVVSGGEEFGAETVAVGDGELFNARIEMAGDLVDLGCCEVGAQAVEFGANLLEEIGNIWVQVLVSTSAGRAVMIFTLAMRLRSISSTMNVREP